MRSWPLAVAAVVLTAAGARALDVPITVTEPAGVARPASPVSGGIPLPQGQFRKDQPFGLFDAAGKEVPLQALPLVVDEKGFLRWVLLDFQTDLKPGEKRAFTLRTVKGTAAPAAPVKVTRTDGGVTVDTGAVAFTIAADQPFSLVTSASAGGKAITTGGKVSYTDGFSGKTYTADKPESIAVEYAGPLRATVCVRGRFVGDGDTKLRYVARITAWAGRSAVHVKYSLANSNPDHYAFRQVKDSTVRLGLAAKPGEAILGASKPITVTGDAWMQQSARVVSSVVHNNDRLGRAPWLRRTPGGAKAMAGDKDLWTSAGRSDVAEGWVAVRAGDARLLVADLYFVEDPPRRLAVTGSNVVLTGVTVPLEGAAAPFGEPMRWLFDCSHLSSEYLIDFAAPADPANLSRLAKAARQRPHALAPSSWYFETEALPTGTFGTLADELACYKAWGWKYDPKDVTKGPVGQMARINRWVAADDNHFTSEQDTLDGLFLMYLRTGNRAFFDAAHAWANYFMDLQTWRTDGWRWKDGGVWWTNHGSPIGSSPRRAADPVTGMRNRLVLSGHAYEAGKTYRVKSVPVPLKIDLTRTAAQNIHVQADAKACHCHNWGEGLAEWFLITGDRDAYDAAIDTVEQNIDTQKRAFRKAPGKPARFSRDFTRACYLTNATRLIAPTDPFVTDASDDLAAVFLGRPNPEPRGFLNGPSRVDMNTIRRCAGEKGVARMKELGVTLDGKTGELVDPKTGARWRPIAGVNTWMYPPLSRAMETYYAVTGNEDALDWLIAYGHAVGEVMYQRHGNQHPSILVDFPVRGVAKDRASWESGDDNQWAKGIRMSGYLATFYPDVPARAYAFSGEQILKQRAYDYWFGGSHRGYGATKLHRVGGVGQWVNVYSTHGETVSFTGKTFSIWAHPRKDDKPPEAVTDLTVAVDGDKTTVTFTAPADQGGGAVARYQVKCSSTPIVGYEAFLAKFNAHEDTTVTNWWMAANVTGEPAPGAAGRKVTLTVIGVPDGVRHFAVRSFDDSSNRSALSNAAMVE